MNPTQYRIAQLESDEKELEAALDRWDKRIALDKERRAKCMANLAATRNRLAEAKRGGA